MIGQSAAIISGRGEMTRYGPLFNFFEVLKADGNILFGKGLNTSKAFFGEDAKEHLNREFSILHFSLFSFGVVGVISVLVLLFYTFFKIWHYESIEVLIVYSSFMFSSLINSSGGHVLYKFCYIFIIQYFLLRLLNIKNYPISYNRI